MINHAEIQALLRRAINPKSPILSAFLDVNPQNAANINRGHIAALKSMLNAKAARLDLEGRRHFDRDAERVLDWVGAYDVRAKSLAIFCDASEDFFWARELRVPLANRVEWGQLPDIRPLGELLDDHERTLVVLTDHTRTRFFNFFLDEIEELEELGAVLEVQHVPAPGRTQMDSEAMQHKAQAHARLHFKEVARRMADYGRKWHIDWFLPAGMPDAAAELMRVLDEPVARRVADFLPLAVGAPREDVRAAASAKMEELERRHELEIVEDLITEARKKKKASIGLHGILEAARNGRIFTLVYADGVRPSGGQCAQCAFLYDNAREGDCAYCGGKVRPIEDLLEVVSQYVVQAGGKIEQVKGRAAERLKSVEGVGAFLRFQP